MSKHKARPCDLAWVRSIVGQCKAAKVSVFIKQLGSRPTDGERPPLSPKELLEGMPGRPRPADQPLTDETARQILGKFADRAILNAVHLHDRKGGDPSEWPEDLRVREFPVEREGTE